MLRFVNETAVSASLWSRRWSHQVLVGCPVAGSMYSKATYDIKSPSYDFIFFSAVIFAIT